MGLISCPLPCHSAGEKEEDSYNYSYSYSQSHSYRRRSSYFSSSSSRSYSSSSLSSQRSLQSVPSLSSSSLHLLDPGSIHHQCVTTLKGHTSHVYSLILAGKHLYSGSYDDDIRVWPRNPHLTPPPPYPVTTTRGAAVKSLAVFGDRLFSAHQDHKIRVWKINNNDTLNRRARSYECVATLPTLNDRFLNIFSPKNYVQVRRHKSCIWVHHVDTVSSLALSRDGAHLYSASWDRTFKVWRTKDFRCLESVAGAHDDAINSIALSHDGHVYTGSADRTIKVWKKKDGTAKKHSLVATLARHRSAVNALALSADGNVLYSGACDRSIIVWERSSDGGEHMVVAGALRGHTKAILCLAVVDDLLVSGSADNTIRIWRRSSTKEATTTSFLEGGDGKRGSYECLAVLEGHSKPVKCLAAAVDLNCSTGLCSGSGKGKGRWYLVYSGSLDCDIRVWRVWIPCV